MIPPASWQPLFKGGTGPISRKRNVLFKELDSKTDKRPNMQLFPSKSVKFKGIEPSVGPRPAHLRLPSRRRRRRRPQHCRRPATTSSPDITSDSTTKRASRAHPPRVRQRPPPPPPAQTHWRSFRWNLRQPPPRQRQKQPHSDQLTISNITPL